MTLISFYRPKKGLDIAVRMLLLAACLIASLAWAQSARPTWPDLSVGDPIRAAVDALRAQGLQIAYDEDELDDSVVLREIPGPTDAIDALIIALRPYGLSVVDVDGLWAIGTFDAQQAATSAVDDIATQAAQGVADEIVVAASYYHLIRDVTSLPNLIDQAAIIQFPDFGDDPIRSIARLPGVAASGSSARSHIRGANQGETSVILDGHRLLDPFHVRDYQSLFSAIDVRAIDRLEVYTGGFPIEYGDSVGGLILVDSVDTDVDRYTALGLSVFNSSILSYGRVGDGQADWVFSARRGNLDLVLNPDLGEPSYYDIFAKVGLRPTSRSRVSLSAILLEDTVLVVPAADPDEREESRNDSRNVQIWLAWDQDWYEGLSSTTQVSVSDLLSERAASINDPEKIIGTIDDRRDINLLQISQQWRARVSKHQDLRFGADYRNVSGTYDYQSDFGYFGLFADTLSLPANGANVVLAERDGDAFSAYLASRWRIGDRMAVDVGLRWDKQTYTDLNASDQLSPRIGAWFKIDDSSSLRLSWGRFHQSQGIHELQVEDAVTNFFPAQRSDQIIVSYERDLGDSHRLRVEAYDKQESRIRPRFENTLDPFSIVPELEPDRTRVAPSSARAQGLEVSLEYASRSPWRWWALYALARVDERIGNRTVPRSWDQRHSAQVGTAFEGDKWGFSAAIKAHSGWPKTDVRLVDNPVTGEQQSVIGPRNADRYDAFVTLDLRLDYRRKFSRGTFTWFFEIANATNRNNACCVDFDLDPDGNGGAVLDRKEDYWFPLLPATGILWEF